ATCVVKSGGQWVDEDGGPPDKLHGHWRFGVPARGEDELAQLERARKLAAELGDGGPSHAPGGRPIRWPGSWARQDRPPPRTIARSDQGQEIDLEIVLTALETATIKEKPQAKSNGKDKPLATNNTRPPIGKN